MELMTELLFGPHIKIIAVAFLFGAFAILAWPVRPK